MRDHTRAIRERTRENRRAVISLEQLFDMIADEETAERLFERMRWPHGRCCPRCGSVDTYRVANRHPQPFRCRDCKRYFSLRTDTVLAHSNLPIRKWVIAMYFMSTSIKGVSSAHLARVLRVRHATAWMLAHKIREGFTEFNSGRKLSGTLEVDETYIGGLEKNKHSDKRLRAGRGSVGKAIVVGILDRRTRQVYAEVVPDTRTVTLQRFVRRHAKAGSTLYSDEAPAYDGMPGLPPDRGALQGPVRRRRGAHERHRVVLGTDQARPQGCLPQDVAQAPAQVRRGVHGPQQRAPHVHAQTAALSHRGIGGQVAALEAAHRLM